MDRNNTFTINGCTFVAHYAVNERRSLEAQIDYVLPLSCEEGADILAAGEAAKAIVGMTHQEANAYLKNPRTLKFRPSFQKATLHSGGTFYVVAQDAEDKEQVRYLLLCTPQGPVWMPIEQTKPIPWD